MLRSDEMFLILGAEPDSPTTNAWCHRTENRRPMSAHIRNNLHGLAGIANFAVHQEHFGERRERSSLHQERWFSRHERFSLWERRAALFHTVILRWFRFPKPRTDKWSYRPGCMCNAKHVAHRGRSATSGPKTMEMKTLGLFCRSLSRQETLTHVGKDRQGGHWLQKSRENTHTGAGAKVK